MKAPSPRGRKARHETSGRVRRDFAALARRARGENAGAPGDRGEPRRMRGRASAGRRTVRSPRRRRAYSRPQRALARPRRGDERPVLSRGRAGECRPGSPSRGHRPRLRNGRAGGGARGQAVGRSLSPPRRSRLPASDRLRPRNGCRRATHGGDGDANPGASRASPIPTRRANSWTPRRERFAKRRAPRRRQGVPSLDARDAAGPVRAAARAVRHGFGRPCATISKTRSRAPTPTPTSRRKNARFSRTFSACTTCGSPTSWCRAPTSSRPPLDVDFERAAGAFPHGGPFAPAGLRRNARRSPRHGPYPRLRRFSRLRAAIRPRRPAARREPVARAEDDRASSA